MTLSSDEQLQTGLGSEFTLDLTSDPPMLGMGNVYFALDDAPPSRTQRVFVRTFDIFGSIVGIVLSLPMMLVVALVVFFTSPGPIIFKSPRIGQRDKTFNALKFRTMVPSAEQLLATVLADDPDAAEEYQLHHKLRDEPRITGTGRFLRRTSLDELPQLFNVLGGQMSLVGPRPKLLTERERYGPTLETVLRVRPGLTGLWQVSGRSELDFDQRIVLDLQYALNRSFIMDFTICIRTVGHVLRPEKSGAY